MASSGYRQTAFENHGRECEDCGVSENLHVHHKDRDQSNNDPENLVVLCEEHHWDRHRDEVAERASGGQSGGGGGKADAPIQYAGAGTDEMRAVDWEIVDVLEEGRNNAPNIAERTDYSSQYIRERLRFLWHRDVLEDIGSGIYELNPEEVPDPESD